MDDKRNKLIQDAVLDLAELTMFIDFLKLLRLNKFANWVWNHQSSKIMSRYNKDDVEQSR